MRLLAHSLLLALALAGAAASEARAQYSLSTLTEFNGTNGAYPHAGLTLDASGKLYGTTAGGGANGDGTVFEIAIGSHALTTLATFNGTNGAYPYSGFTSDLSGNLYGTTSDDGANGCGTVFEIAAGNHTLTTLVSFNGTNGKNSYAGLTLDASGNLYGTTSRGPAFGNVFEIAAGSSAITTLASFFPTAPPSGIFPESGLTIDASGNLYGTTGQSGFGGEGTVFEIAAGSHTLTTLVTFNGTNGANPQAGLTLDASGNLYGTTSGGGANGGGTVFEIAAGSHALAILATFNGTNGAGPESGLTIDASGNLYGTTAGGGANSDGTAFKIAVGSNVITTLATFNGTNGANPLSGLTLDASGNLYGTTEQGGANNAGTVFELSPTSAALMAGSNQTAVTGGGVQSVGGTQATLPSVTTPGTFNSNYQTATSLGGLGNIISSAAVGAINFALAGLNPDGTLTLGGGIQLWDLHFTGTFTGEATVTLHYDPSLIGNVPASALEIGHYVNGAWVLILPTSVDPVADTITFQTDSFSPFVLAAVPEPSSMMLAAFGVVSLVGATLWRCGSAAAV